jgi:hypothetical protein
MLLFDENYQALTQADINALKADLKNLDGITAPTEEEMEAELRDYYAQAQDLYNQSNQADVATGGPNAAPLANYDGSILDLIRQAICAVLPAKATIDDVVDAVLDFLGDHLWGFFKSLIVKKLIKYLMDMGIDVFCPVPAPTPVNGQ